MWTNDPNFNWPGWNNMLMLINIDWYFSKLFTCPPEQVSWKSTCPEQNLIVFDERTSVGIFTVLVGDGSVFIMQIDCFQFKVILLAQVH